jgi:hypothetical protein
VLVALVALEACASAPTASIPSALGVGPADSLWVRDEIFFGSQIPTGGEVGPEQWEGVPGSGAQNEAQVIALMAAYRKAFAQESVLRVTSPATVRFYY